MIEESAENRIYKKLVEEQLQVDDGSFCPFRKEKQMEYLFDELRKDFEIPGQKVLDMCGGYGRLTHFLYEFDPNQHYFCLDYSEDLISRAHKSFAGNHNIHCDIADIYELSTKYEKSFDFTILYKTLYCLPYYTQAVEQLVCATRKKIYITSPFFDGDIDFISRIYMNASTSNESSYHYSNAYGIPKFESYCHNLGVRKVEFVDMPLDFDLEPPQSKDVLKTYTIRTADGNRLEICGALMLNWKLAILTL